MADKQPSLVHTLATKPGIQRDGTDLDSDSYTDGQWVRFQRGRPKKMGGYRELSATLNGPVRSMSSWSRQNLMQVSLFSPWGIEAIQIDQNGVGQALYDRTPSGFVVDGNAIWQTATMYDAAAGSTKTLLFAHPGSNLANIDNGISRDIYYGDAADTTPLQAIGGTAFVSGGIVAMPPYLTIYGSDGRVSWSNANEPRNFSSGDANTARVAGAKIVKGLPIRGQGTSPSALLWSLDAVIRMSYVGGQAIFRFDATSNESSILSSSSVIEYDGIYYWVGIDRFMMYNGRVQELPNNNNLNWFFDNLNYNHRQKVHVVKVTRYGEIWWFFPFGDATECTHAVVYNVRENYWFDVELGRSCGSSSSVFRYPLWMDSLPKQYVDKVTVASATGFVVGDTATGGTSLATGKIKKILGNDLYVAVAAGMKFQSGEAITGLLGGSSTASADSVDVGQYQLWLHEFGKNKVEGDSETGIPSFFDTDYFGFPIDAPSGQSAVGPNSWTRISRVEPDFNLTGTLRMQVIGKKCANSSETDTTQEYVITKGSGNVDIREQHREAKFRFISNETQGDYEMGRLLIHLEEGDGRS